MASIGRSELRQLPVDMPEDWPLVGVIVPMYNASQTIDATLTSICAQTYRNLDIVVVDDGSTDDSGKSAQMWAEREPRLRLLRQLNSGVAAARNFGAANTPAEYLAFIDADDLWAPEKIEVQMRTLLNGESELGLCIVGMRSSIGLIALCHLSINLRPRAGSCRTSYRRI